jgi:inhibitor of KinA sporulation pathway (predicted exonuclease)
MAKQLDKIVIVDIESTCWDGPIPENQFSEIIEIGVCLLDVNSGEIEKNEGILIKPKDSEVSDFCTQLTTITPEMTTAGISFEAACARLESEFLSKKRIWASYGAYDINMFQKQCARTAVKYPFGEWHINVKTLVSLKLKLQKEIGMSGALGILEIPLEGTHHRGVDDAKNIAKLMSWVLRNE